MTLEKSPKAPKYSKELFDAIKALPVADSIDPEEIVEDIKRVNPNIPEPRFFPEEYDPREYNPDHKFIVDLETQGRILENPFFLIAWYLGNIRLKHPEGAAAYHVIRLQDLLIQCHSFFPKEYMEPLLIIATLHDYGKIAEINGEDLIEFEDKNVPTGCTEEIKAQIRKASRIAHDLYDYPIQIDKDIADFYPDHAPYSAEFARQMGITNDDILDVLEAHDCLFKLYKYKNSEIFNRSEFEKVFKKIFSKVHNIPLLLWSTLFDNAAENRTKVTQWSLKYFYDFNLIDEDTYLDLQIQFESVEKHLEGIKAWEKDNIHEYED